MCPICGSARDDLFTKTVLNAHAVAYFLCRGCGLVQTEKPYWLKESYSSALAGADTGVVGRNLRLASRIAMVMLHAHGPDARYIDIAGGPGLLVRMMRDSGLDYFWEDRYSENTFARGFEAVGSFDAASAIEVFEHLEDPLDFVRSALDTWSIRSLVFTTELWEGMTPDPDWWYLVPSTGQHISFFQRRTLERIASMLGLNFVTSGSLHMFSADELDERRFRVLTGRAGPWLWIRRRRQLASKTWDDHLKMIGTSG